MTFMMCLYILRGSILPVRFVYVFLYIKIFSFFFFQDLRIILIFANVFYNYDDKH